MGMDLDFYKNKSREFISNIRFHADSDEKFDMLSFATTAFKTHAFEDSGVSVIEVPICKLHMLKDWLIKHRETNWQYDSILSYIEDIDCDIEILATW